jgi:proteasome accessory factor C
MLTLVPWLAARPGVTLRETAEHFGISQETLEADLWQIILCGLPGYGPDQLVDIDFWDDGAIYVHDAQTLTSPLRLSPEESAAILLGLRALAQTPGLAGNEAVVSAVAKLQSALDLKEDTSEVVPAVTASAETSETLQHAITQRSRVTLEYGSSDGEVTVRDVWPQHTIAIDGFTYVTGWCERAESLRTFRVDRILRAEPSSAQGTVPIAEVHPWWEDIDVHRARVRVSASRSWVLDEASGVEIIDDSGPWLEASLGFANIAWLTNWVLRNPGTVVVLEPAWVVDDVLTRAERLIEAPLLRRG